MVYYIRTKENKTLIDIDFWQKSDFYDVKVSYSIKDLFNYFLNNKDFLNEPNLQKDFIDDLEVIQNIRTWVFEEYNQFWHLNKGEGSDSVKKDIQNYVETLLNDFAKQYDLKMVTD